MHWHSCRELVGVPALTLVLAALPLSALELKKYASGRGIDANVCSLTPPKNSNRSRLFVRERVKLLIELFGRC